MWKPTTSSSSASSSGYKRNIKEVLREDECSGVEQYEQQPQKQKNNSKYLQQKSTFGAQFTDSTEQKEIDLTGETSDSGFISGPHTTSSINIETEQQQEEEGAGAVGIIKTLNIPGSLSEPQLQEHHQHPNLKYQEKQQQDIDSVHLEIDSEQLQPKSQQHFDTVAGCIEEGDIKFKYNGDAGLPELGVPKEQQQQKPSSSSSSFVTGPPIFTVRKQTSPATMWEKYYQQNDQGNTRLHLECASGNVAAVTSLIRMAPHPALFSIQNDVEQTALHLATLAEKTEIVRLLLMAGAEPTVRDSRGNTALHLACAYGTVQCVEALTTPICAYEINVARSQFGHCATDYLLSDLEVCNYEGKNCVHLAAESGSIGILRILVTYGADINAREVSAGFTPLHIAIKCCDGDLANYLLNECPKINLDATNYVGLTPYQFACKYNLSEMRNMFEKKGAQPLMPSESDSSSSCWDRSDSEMDLYSDSSDSEVDVDYYLQKKPCGCDRGFRCVEK